MRTRTRCQWALMTMGLVGCSSSRDIETHADAPFELKSAKSMLWATDPLSDEEDGAGVLLISNTEMGCNAITQGELIYDIEDVVLNGEGLLFVVQYDSRGDYEHGRSFEGLWTSGYAYGGGRERRMLPMAFSGGFLYFISGNPYYGGGGDWLRINNQDQGGVTGEYATTYWSGSFDTKNCGNWAGQEYGESGFWYSESGF